MKIVAARRIPSSFLKTFFFSIMGSLVIYQVVLVYGLFADLEFADESSYLENGKHFWDFLFRDGFIYFVYYKVLLTVFKDPVNVYFLNFLFSSILFFLAISLPLELRHRPFPYSGVPSLLGILVATDFRFLTAWPFITKFAALIAVLPLLILSIVNLSPRRFRVIALLTLFLLQYVRPEFFVAFYLFSSYLLARETYLYLHHRSNQKSALVKYAISLSIIISLGVFAGYYPVYGNGRSFVAFGQHYALRMSVTGQLTTNPWTNWSTLITRDFGQAHSISDAIRNNPEKFLSHAAQNGLDFLRKNFLSGLSFWALFILFFAANHFFKDRRRFVSSFLLHLDLVSFIFVSILPVFAAIIVIYPRPHYAVLLAPFLVYSMLRMSASMKRETILLIITGAIVLILTANLVRFSSLVPNRNLGPCANLFRVSFLNSHPDLPDPVRVLQAEGSLCMYLNRNCNQVSDNEKNPGWTAFLQSQEINVIFLDEKLKKDIRFKDDNEFASFQKNTEKYGFTVDRRYLCPETRLLIKKPERRFGTN